jgi:ubiquinone/menaquinone biosynthesis C-methylase UbiE
LSVEVARRVGPSGRVYSTELGDEQLDRIRATASRGGVSNVTVLQAGDRTTNLRTSCCHAVFMRRVYHHLQDPPAIVSDLLRAVKPGGRLVIIEFERSGLLGTITREGIDRADLVTQVTSGGFELVTVTEWPGTSHYVGVFRKAGDGGL